MQSCAPPQALPVLYPPLRDVISVLSFSQLVGVLKEFTIVAPEASEMILTLACQNEVWDVFHISCVCVRERDIFGLCLYSDRLVRRDRK